MIVTSPLRGAITALVGVAATVAAGRTTNGEATTDGRVLASGSAEATLRLSDPDGNLIRMLDVETDPLLNLAWSPDGQLLAVGGFLSFRTRPPGSNAIPGVVRLVRRDGQLLATIRTQQTGGKFLHLIWSPDGTMLAGGAIDFYLWRMDGTVVATLRQTGTPAPAMAWSPRGDRIAIGDENGRLLIYEASGKILTSAGAFGPVRDVAFSPDGRTLAIFSGNGISLLATASPDAAPRLIHDGTIKPGLRHAANLAWSPDGTRLVTATRDGVLRVWSADGTPLATLDGCSGEILRIAWSPDGRTLVAGSQQNAACLWRP
jgi:WD40 repeat protein